MILGATTRVTAKFYDSAGALVDPLSVTVRITTSAGVQTTLVYLTDLALVRLAAGTYYIDSTPTGLGSWTYLWTGTGPSGSRQQIEIQVVNP
jgi:hypothetical protein